MNAEQSTRKPPTWLRFAGLAVALIGVWLLGSEMHLNNGTSCGAVFNPSGMPGCDSKITTRLVFGLVVLLPGLAAFVYGLWITPKRKEGR